MSSLAPAGGSIALRDALDPALAVGNRAFGFTPARGRREHHIGHLGGRRQEDVLNDEAVKPLQPVPGLRLVGLGLERVLSEHVERAELAPLHRLEHLRHVPAALGGDCNSPAPLELLPKLGELHVLESGQPVGQRPHVAPTLHVILPAERVQAGAVAAHVPGQQGQIDQGEHVIDGVVVLGDAQCPADHRPAGPGVGSAPCPGSCPRGLPFLSRRKRANRAPRTACRIRIPSWRVR